MDQTTLEKLLAGLPLGGLRYFDSIGSTNDEARRWAESGVPDLALVVADEQTAGRGRAGRRWFTPAGAALAFSLALRPSHSPHPHPLPQNRGRGDEVSSPFPEEGGQREAEVDTIRYTALGALAVCTALEESFGLAAKIKWPNDVLAGRRKLAGVLAEALWLGDELTAVIVGIGINIAPISVPSEAELLFPATCVEGERGEMVNRWQLLRAALQALLGWRIGLASPEFIQAWEARLAYRGEWVQVGEGSSMSLEGVVLGLDGIGRLRLETSNGNIVTVQPGGAHLRPVDR